MKCFYLDTVDTCSGNLQRHILWVDAHNNIIGFPLTDDNPNKAAYDAWLAEGNEPEEWTDGN